MICQFWPIVALHVIADAIHLQLIAPRTTRN
jgi:hypothetical protein